MTQYVVDVTSCPFTFYTKILRMKKLCNFIFDSITSCKKLTHFSPLQVLDDWKFVASVLDRLLLIVFLTVTIFGSMGILMQTPYILEYVDQDEIIQKLMKKYMK